MPRSYERTPKDEAVSNASVVGLLTIVICLLAMVLAGGAAILLWIVMGE